MSTAQARKPLDSQIASVTELVKAGNRDELLDQFKELEKENKRCDGREWPHAAELAERASLVL